MEDGELIERIYHGREERNLEYKQSMPWADAPVKAKIAKSIMAMANLQDGGDVIIGVRRNADDTYTPDGVIPDHLGDLTHDNMASFVHEYAAPFVEFSVSRVDHDGKAFVVVRVQEFAELPIVCRKSGEEGLKPGAFFTRGRRIHETVAVSNEPEMRELIELAADKSSKRLLARASRAGLLSTEDREAAQARFDQELGGL